MRRRKKRAEADAFQMAPMIDMVFLLLVFFMTVSNLASESRPEMELAESGVAKVEVEAEALPLVLSWRGEKGWQVGLEVVGDAVGEAVDAGMGEEGVLIRVPRELAYGEWAAVLGQLQGRGCSAMSLAVYEGR